MIYRRNAGACGCSGYALVIGGIFFLFVDKLFKKNEEVLDQHLRYSSALKIGFFQTIAMIPEVKIRAIIWGPYQNLNKRTAASFLLPTVLTMLQQQLIRCLNL
jgi:undecaprenyl-diphosphatase